MADQGAIGRKRSARYVVRAVSAWPTSPSNVALAPIKTKAAVKYKTQAISTWPTAPSHVALKPIKTHLRRPYLRKMMMLDRIGNVYDGIHVANNGVISGVVTENGTPVGNCLVRLYYRPNGYLLESVFSDASGAFSFAGYDQTRLESYTAVAFDIATGTVYNALIWDQVTPYWDSSTLPQRSYDASGSAFGTYGTPAVITGDPYWNRVIAMLHMDGTNGSTTLRDETGRSWATSGGAALSTTAPFCGTASLFLDGNDDYAIATHPLFALGTDDFTIEMWLNLSSSSGTYPRLIQIGTDSVQGGLWLIRPIGFTTFFVQIYNTSGGYVNVIDPTSTGATIGTPQHIALQRTGTTWSLYLDGALIGSKTYSSVGTNIVQNTLRIGNSSSANEATNGFVDEFRVTRGVARYSGASFTVPIAPFIDGGTGTDAAYSSVYSLAHFGDDGSGNVDLTDEKSFSWSVSGTIALNTTNQRFGSGCMDIQSDSYAYFGNGGSPTISYGSNDFTMEGWFRPTDVSIVRGLMGLSQFNSTAGPRTNLMLNTDLSLTGYMSNGTEYINNASAPNVVTLNAWNHIAFTRRGTIIRVFANGVPVLTVNPGVVGNMGVANGSLIFAAGYSYYAGNRYYRGQINDIRYTPGLCRYETPFATPTNTFDPP